MKLMHVSLYLDSESRALLEDQAKSDASSMSNVARRLFKDYLPLAKRTIDRSPQPLAGFEKK